MRKLHIVLLLFAVGCVSLRMLAVDDIGRRVDRIEEVAVELEEATKVVESDEEKTETVSKKEISDKVEVILYECQETKEWIKPLVKDVGPVPEKKQLKLDTPEEEDTRFEYIVKAGAKASKRARRKRLWEKLKSLPKRVVGWVVKTVWDLLPWWIKYPALLILLIWASTTIYIYISKARYTRAAHQAEAAISKLQKYVDEKEFLDAVAPECNLDLAMVHEERKDVALKVKKKKAMRKIREDSDG